MGKYCAGLWKKDLLWHLVWEVDYPDEYNTHDSSLLGTSGNNEHMGEQKMGTQRPKLTTLKPSWLWISTSLPVKWGKTSFTHPITERRYLLPEINPRFLTLRSRDQSDQYTNPESDRLCLMANMCSAVIRIDEGGLCELDLIGADNINRQIAQATLIPDASLPELDLGVACTIHCAHGCTYAEDGEIFWVALGPVPHNSHTTDIRDEFRNENRGFVRIGLVRGKTEITRRRLDEPLRQSNKNDKRYDSMYNGWWMNAGVRRCIAVSGGMT